MKADEDKGQQYWQAQLKNLPWKGRQFIRKNILENSNWFQYRLWWHIQSPRIPGFGREDSLLVVAKNYNVVNKFKNTGPPYCKVWLSVAKSTSPLVRKFGNMQDDLGAQDTWQEERWEGRIGMMVLAFALKVQYCALLTSQEQHRDNSLFHWGLNSLYSLI